MLPVIVKQNISRIASKFLVRLISFSAAVECTLAWARKSIRPVVIDHPTLRSRTVPLKLLHNDRYALGLESFGPADTCTVDPKGVRSSIPPHGIGDGVAEHVEEGGLEEGVELGEGLAALGPQGVRRIQNPRNPLLLGEGREGDLGSALFDRSS